MEEDEYEHESQCEDYVDYGVDGYHPVQLGERFNSVYTVVQKLGWGHFSTVWLAFKQTTKEYLALKIQRSKQSHTDSALDEFEMLTEIRKHEQDQQWKDFLASFQKQYSSIFNSKLCRPLLLVDNFAHFGIHGKHMCSVFELMGPNLLDVIQHYEFKEKRMPLWLVKKITRDVLMGLVYLHERCDIIHTDLKPENIMIKMEPYEEQQIIEQLKSYKVKPISMKYLKNLQASKNPKNKKKLEKKKLKKKMGQQNQNENKEEQKSEVEANHHAVKQQEPSSIKAQSNLQIQSQISNIIQKEQEKSIQNESSIMSEQISPSLDANSSETPSNSSHMQSAVHQQSKIEKKNSSEYQDLQEGVDMSVLQWKSVKIRLNNKLFFKIVDMGNACFSNKHFTQDIQTRQYRSPQVILGYDYFYNTDVFSLACVVFEMLTNNFLFKPKKISGIRRDEDHLYQMIETLGPIEKQFAINGRSSGELFNKKGKLINGSPKEEIFLSRLLVEKYGYDAQVAVGVEEFLLPMLAYEPKNRIDARSCLKSKWLWT